jgi:ABC-type phosphate/phosphonate transport system permease subunit
MSKDTSYKYLETHELPSDLYERVVRATDHVKVKKVKKALLISRLGMIASVIVFVPASLYLYNSFLQTGFMQSFSILFYDGALVTRYWQDFGVALLETLPVTSFMVCVGLLFAFLVSLWSSLRNSSYYKELQLMNV